jgi:flagellar biosynthesis/type III secretory pathway protein FliH
MSAYIDEALERAKTSKAPTGNVVMLRPREPEKTEIKLSDHANALEEMRERENTETVQQIVSRVERDYHEAWVQGYEFGKDSGRFHLKQAVMATSVAWIALFGLALVWLP